MLHYQATNQNYQRYHRLQYGLEDAKELESEVVIGYREPKNAVAIDYQDEEMVAYLDVVDEKQGIETQHALKHYTIGSDQEMVEGWDVYPGWLEKSPQ